MPWYAMDRIAFRPSQPRPISRVSASPLSLLARTAGPRQAIDEPGTDRIGDLNKHDWDRARRLQKGRHGCGARGQDDVRRERDQFRRVFAHVVGIARAPTIIDPNVAAVDPTRLL